MQGETTGINGDAHQQRTAVEDFAHWLRTIKLQAGDPSYRDLARLTRQASTGGPGVPRSTLHDGFTGRRLLSLDHALTAVKALAGPNPELLAECHARWRRARAGATTSNVFLRRDANRAASDPPRTGVPFLHVEVTCHGSWTVLAVRGEIDIVHARDLKQRIEHHVKTRPADLLVIDLSRTTFMDSTGIGVLIYALKKCRQLGVTFRVVVRPGEQGKIHEVQKIFSITGMDKVFSIYPNAALAARDGLPNPRPPAG